MATSTRSNVDARAIPPSVSAAVELRNVRVGHAIGEDVKEISGDAIIQAFGVEAVACENDIEISPGICGAGRHTAMMQAAILAVSVAQSVLLCYTSCGENVHSRTSK